MRERMRRATGSRQAADFGRRAGHNACAPSLAAVGDQCAAQAADGFPMLQIGPLDVDQRPDTIAADDERMEYDPKPLSVPEVVAFATVVFSVAAFVVLYSLR